MPRILAVFVALVALTAGVSLDTGSTRPAGATQPGPSTSATTLPPPAPPRAWVVVDADTGAVIDGGNHREPMRVASLIKILTALVIAERVEPDELVEVSARAAGMPARKLSLLEGERWRADHLLHALLLVSANDAAATLAEHTAGSLEEFGAVFAATGRRLGFADDPVLLDPSGLDDEFSVGGGNFVSARDLAVATRAFVARPEVLAIVGLPEYRFVGGDNEPHVLRNHNRMLRLYPGTVGGKTGYTKRSGHCLVAIAQRDGRTMIAVVVGSGEPYRSAALLLDRAFSVLPSEQGSMERLPPVPPTVTPRRAVAVAPEAAAADPTAGADDGEETSTGVSVQPRDAALLAVGGMPALAILARRRRQSRRNDVIHPFRI